MKALAKERADILSSVESILEDVRKGKPVIIVDDEDRENEGDLMIAASMASPENINFMAREGRGLICLPMDGVMIDRLGLPLMGRGDNARHKTAFTVSIEAKQGVTTGISAADRARTILTAIDPASGPNDIATPGHVFPLRAREGGVLVRAGHTEATVDLAALAGFSRAAVICEIMNDDGTMACMDNLVPYAQRHGLKIGSIADLIAYRRRTENLVENIHQEKFSSRYGGEFELRLYASKIEYAEHVALIKGNVKNTKDPIYVRMHALDLFEDILGGSADSTLHRSMELIGREETGVVVILRPPKPKQLSGRLKKDEDGGQDLRDYGIGAQILLDIGVRDMILLTDNPKNVVGLDGFGLHIHGYRPVRPENGKP